MSGVRDEKPHSYRYNRKYSIYIIDLGFENEIQGIEKNCIRITGSKGIKEYKRDEGKYR